MGQAVLRLLQFRDQLSPGDQVEQERINARKRIINQIDKKKKIGKRGVILERICR